MTDKPETPPRPATPEEIAAWICMAAALLLAFHLKLIAVVLAGFLSHMLLHSMAGVLRGRRVSHGLARALAAWFLGLLAAAIVTAAFILLHGFVRGRFGDLPAVLESAGETLRTLRETLERAGFSLPMPGGGEDARSAGTWIHEHAGELRNVGMAGVRGIVHALVGAVLGVLVFLGTPAESSRPFAKALVGRVRRFDDAFRSVARAQIEISALNTVMSALFLFGGLPLFGVHLPQRGTLVLLTFISGLVPVAGNLFSNTVIVLLSLGVSPWAAVASFIYLVAIHKLEYFLNAKIVGGRIGAAAWETLLAIVVFEAAFRIPGVVMAPVIYAWVKGELKERGLV